MQFGLLDSGHFTLQAVLIGAVPAFLPLPDTLLLPPLRHVLLLVRSAALAKQMALPQTACLALSGRLEVPETDGGRMWYTTFEEDGELIQVTRADQQLLPLGVVPAMTTGSMRYELAAMPCGIAAAHWCRTQ